MGKVYIVCLFGICIFIMYRYRFFYKKADYSISKMVELNPLFSNSHLKSE
jgi:hypothetical protein